MSEYTYVEQPILGWLCGEPKAKYGARGVDLSRRGGKRPLEDPWSRSCW
jgi:hypothetical protein